MTDLRVLYLGPFNSPHVEDLAMAMQERGHMVEVGGAVWGGLPASRLPAHGIRTHELVAPSILRLRRLLRRFKPDVVHAQWMPFATLGALAGARPLVASAWGSDVYGASRVGRFMLSLGLRRTSIATADSADLLMQLSALGPGSLRTLLVNWGVDLRRFRPPTDAERAELKARLGLGPGPVVLSPRGLKEIYNPELVVDAFARVRSAMPDAELVLKHGGTNELLPPTWNEQPGVRIIGRVETDELIDLFRASEVTVSIPKSDSSPRSAWEAMATGSATVLSDLPWVHELIVDERDALVVEPNSEAVADAVVRLLRDDARRQEMAASARRLVESHRDRDTELARLEACYRQLAGV